MNESAVGTLMNPASVAVIGASEDQNKYGGRLFKMLLSHGYRGRIMPINPARESLFGVKTFADVAATPDVPDVAVMAIPQPRVRETIEACAARGVQAAIVITARFSDAGPEGAALERDIVDIARAGGIRLVGPNCLGIISPANRVVLCPSTALAADGLPVGRVGFVSQSGALMGTIFDKAKEMGLAFSHAISVGNQADLELSDFVEFMIDDPATSVICTYIEGLKNPRRFAELAARAREAGKPWLAVSAGRTRAGAKAAFSHTASIAGERAVFEAVCREEHVTLLDSPLTMVALATSLADHPRARIDRIAVFSPSGGEAALAADEIEVGDMHMASFADATCEQLGAWFPPSQSCNPVDIGGRTVGDGPDVVGAAASVVAGDGGVDALLFAITTSPTLDRLAADVADALAIDAKHTPKKPVLYVFETGRLADAARTSLRERGRWFSNNLREAVDVLAAWHARSTYSSPGRTERPHRCPSEASDMTKDRVYGEGETRRVLERHGVTVNRERLARNEEEAVALAEAFGFPVVLKVVSPQIVHKSDVGGVRIDLYNEAMVRDAYRRIHADVAERAPQAHIDGLSVQTQFKGKLEMIVGARRDAAFGPIVVFGAGGVMVDLLPVRAIARAPVDEQRVIELLRRLPLWPLFEGFRGARLDLQGVVETIVRVSWLAADLADHDFELDINPLMVSSERVCAVDARLRMGKGQPE
ncbi:acetate--CoA ligase family protein [Caballeronia ptereochthonis]|uniref:N-acetyltransferase GCN5 n=1 Tax=Caballeronia ptereochthonis TaxID=1777144 RepID=A0A158AXW2_9BURK|nr:acetate--CoA ligase family protein [Caballeronia ptereochthonis]SAK62510.1 N-acetyltransferase GCN5 [Caballeronia ptereochthonis]